MNLFRERFRMQSNKLHTRKVIATYCNAKVQTLCYSRNEIFMLTQVSTPVANRRFKRQIFIITLRIICQDHRICIANAYHYSKFYIDACQIRNNDTRSRYFALIRNFGSSFSIVTENVNLQLKKKFFYLSKSTKEKQIVHYVRGTGTIDE